MLEIFYAIALSASAASSGTPCPTEPDSDKYHLSDVCVKWLEGAPAYSATFSGSLMAKPASQQVMIYHKDDAWKMRVAGYYWQPSDPVVTRRNQFKISDADAALITNLISKATMNRLSDLPYYGSDDRLCMDGAKYELAMASAGQMHSAKQHSCAGQTEIHEIAAVFRHLALKYDPDFEGLLSGLKLKPKK